MTDSSMVRAGLQSAILFPDTSLQVLELCVTKGQIYLVNMHLNSLEVPARVSLL